MTFRRPSEPFSGNEFNRPFKLSNCLYIDSYLKGIDRSQDNSISQKSLLCEFLALVIFVRVCFVKRVLLGYSLSGSGEDTLIQLSAALLLVPFMLLHFPNSSFIIF